MLRSKNYQHSSHQNGIHDSDFGPQHRQNGLSWISNLRATIRFCSAFRMAEAILDGSRFRWLKPSRMAPGLGSAVQKAFCDRRYVSVYRSRLPAASPSPLAEIAPPGTELGDILASQRKPRAKPLGQAGPAGSGFCDRTTLLPPMPSRTSAIVAEAIPGVGGVSVSRIVRHYAHSPTVLFRAERT